MARKIYLQINGTTLPVEPSKGYTIEYTDGDSILKTEAGTKNRVIRRLDIPHISVSFDCNKTMLLQMRSYKSQFSVNVSFYDSSKDDMTDEVMYITGYSEKMLSEDSNDDDNDNFGIWRVSFDLEDIEYV